TTGVSDLTFFESGIIYWTFTDSSGNHTTATQNVIISDTTAPKPDVTTLPRKTITGCQISNISELDIPTATDACEGLIYGKLSDNFEFPYLFYGTRPIEWEFIDSHGNISTQIQEIELIQANIYGGTLKGTFQSSVFDDKIEITSCGEEISIDLKLTGERGSIIN